MNNSKRVVISVVFLFVVTVLFFHIESVCAQPNDAMQATFEKSTHIWNEGKMELVDEVYAADAVRHGVDGEDIVGQVGNIDRAYNLFMFNGTKGKFNNLAQDF